MGYAPFLVPVGGFLGSGKTTLILAAARLLQETGLRTAAILNDQGSELVDTAYLLQHGISAGEVAGACFCCRFSQLLSTADRLRTLRPDVIFLEPVGSCTDLAATVMRPLLAECEGRYRVGCLTVLVDPARFTNSDDPSIRFLLEKQIAEADLVAFSKSDLFRELPSIPGRVTRSLSARTGRGVRAWLDEVLSGELPAGAKPLQIDYAAYAHAEAALGWLNWSGSVELNEPLTPAELIGPWLEGLQRRLGDRNAEVAHLKVVDLAGGSWLKAAAISNDRDPVVEGDLAASPQLVHAILINIRAVIEAGELEQLFKDELQRTAGRKVARSFQCFSPSAPQPERRIAPDHRLLDPQRSDGIDARGAPRRDQSRK